MTEAERNHKKALKNKETIDAQIFEDLCKEISDKIDEAVKNGEFHVAVFTKCRRVYDVETLFRKNGYEVTTGYSSSVRGMLIVKVDW